MPYFLVDFLLGILSAISMASLKNLHLPSAQYGFHTCIDLSCL